ncbi:MAG: carboxymuconolactone decarboxylase family protein [Deltaproteobacteria bacterium]|nr:carboxymuconolactone decarboxylase family protein [Deltaproteobacteria bacterium]
MDLPEIFTKFVEDHGDIADKFKEISDLCSKVGKLGSQSQHLVQLGVSIGAGSVGAVKSHARRALEAGLSKEDLVQATLLSATTVGFPAMIAAYSWVQEVISHMDTK